MRGNWCASTVDNLATWCQPAPTFCRLRVKASPPSVTQWGTVDLYALLFISSSYPLSELGMRYSILKILVSVASVQALDSITDIMFRWTSWTQQTGFTPVFDFTQKILVVTAGNWSAPELSVIITRILISYKKFVEEIDTLRMLL